MPIPRTVEGVWSTHVSRPRREGDQLPPIPQPGADIQTLVIDDLRERRDFGHERYGTGVQPFNGRKSMLDLYHELMDAVVYARQYIEEERITMLEDDVVFRSDMTVELVQSAASDASVVTAARVSTRGEQSLQLGEDLPAGGRDDGLIRYLMKARHGSPFEHTSMTFLVQAPIFVFRELMRHRIACLGADTLILFESENGNGHWKRIDDHYRDWHEGVLDSLGRRRTLPSVRAAKVRSYDEDTLEKRRSTVLDVVASGVKPVFRITTNRGFTISASADHPFLGPAGWMKVKDLTVGAAVYVQGRSSKAQHASAVPPSLRQGIQVWLTSRRDAIYEREGGTCAGCGLVDPDQWRVDHRLPVAAHLALALDESNLQILCLACDRRKTSSEQLLARRPSSFTTVTWDVIASIEPLGEQMTYDLVLADPHHNFMANGFVVHNSYNEESGRYRELQPVFYMPAADRDLVQVGKPGHYQFEPGTPAQAALVENNARRIARVAYDSYRQMLADGVAREVARIVLPVSIYSSCYVTMNARALMNFLSLRTTSPTATFPSHPQREIEMVAEGMERAWRELMPLTHAAFDAAGRVAP